MIDMLWYGIICIDMFCYNIFGEEIKKGGWWNEIKCSELEMKLYDMMI